MDEGCTEYQMELSRLADENAALRNAALAFGELAERLNRALQQERQIRERGADCRSAAGSLTAFSRTS
jgi:hypothetical protein